MGFLTSLKTLINLNRRYRLGNKSQCVGRDAYNQAICPRRLQKQNLQSVVGTQISNLCTYDSPCLQTSFQSRRVSGCQNVPSKWTYHHLELPGSLSLRRTLSGGTHTKGLLEIYPIDWDPQLGRSTLGNIRLLDYNLTPNNRVQKILWTVRSPELCKFVDCIQCLCRTSSSL